ncbi:ABC transporter ATP-binding protein [Streptomyces sporangiiformans]|uniref:ABC transporter ATP-binding protein n=1 Tax=Streptomyces sporangiiformans TaxID=2315329 RepID=A0A505CZM0_9ACTN|nr:ABC transporter ATP-binding protein [Streptomyces sporangiiformans]TPQ15790.1 ABC transporter ATP-binding protein [Streptomyces sporangiiformans]
MSSELPSMDPLLSVRDLRVSFGAVQAVRGLSFDVHEGEVLAVAGESGAGKSLTARALLGMPPRGATVTGSVRLGSDELVGAPRSARTALWGRRVALVPQDALSALSPVHRVADQLAAAVRSVDRTSRKEARARAVAALEEVGIPADQARAYPHEFSGGMRQRAVIAMAMLHQPDLVVADEPTTAQDPQTRRQMLDLLARRTGATGTALVLVTHDLDTAREHADRLLVMYAGRLVEAGPVEEVFARPRAPYTAGLLASVPGEGLGAVTYGAPPRGRGRPQAAGRFPTAPPAERLAERRRLPAIAGAPPAPTDLPPGCAFAPRCPLADATRCRTEQPEPQTHDGRTVACHRWRELPDDPAELFLESL